MTERPCLHPESERRVITFASGDRWAVCLACSRALGIAAWNEQDDTPFTAEPDRLVVVIREEIIDQ